MYEVGMYQKGEQEVPKRSTSKENHRRFDVGDSKKDKVDGDVRTEGQGPGERLRWQMIYCLFRVISL